MILCLDAGNTRLKWGLCEAGELCKGGGGREGRIPRENVAWRARGAVDHAAIDTLFSDLPVVPTRLLACNVAGSRVAAAIESLAQRWAVPLRWFASSTAACGVSNGYDDPTRLGPDRWAALIGARSLHSGDALVVMAGTATTIDVLGADGRFRGGLILPGLEMMRTALAQNTAGLPVAYGTYADTPTNTNDAIVSGIVHATLGAIERMSRHAGRNDFTVVLSGGAANLLAPHLHLPFRQVEHLVLEGLACHAAECVW